MPAVTKRFLKKQMEAILLPVPHRATVLLMPEQQGTERVIKIWIAGSPDRLIEVPWSSAEVHEVIT